MKSALSIIAACLVILLLPATLYAINDFRMTDYEEGHNITTEAAETTASVQLSQKLFNDDTSLVSASSNCTQDAPIPSSFVPATDILTITGLAEDTSRLLTLTYKIDALEDYMGAGIGARVWPIFLVLGVIGLVVSAVYSAMRHGE